MVKPSIAKRATKVSSKVKTKKSSTSELFIPGPDDLNEPPDDFLAYMTMIYGSKGIGKSSTLGSLPGNFTLMFEPARKNLKIRMQQMHPYSVAELEKGAPDPWQMMKDYLKMAEDDDTVKSVSIDSIDECFSCCMNSVCHREGIRHPGEVSDYGASWKFVEEEFARTFNEIKYSGVIGILFTSHLKERAVEIDTGLTGKKKPKNYAPTCSGQTLAYVKKACDYVFLYTEHKRQRAMHVRWGDDIFVACGTEDHFLDAKTERPLFAFAMPDDWQKSGPELIRAFDNKCTELIDIDDDDEEEEETPPPRRSKKK